MEYTRKLLPLLLVILSSVAGIVTTVWVSRTGHEGAKAVWYFTPKAPAGGGDHDGG